MTSVWLATACIGGFAPHAAALIEMLEPLARVK